jgi:hypothetical protein
MLGDRANLTTKLAAEADFLEALKEWTKDVAPGWRDMPRGNQEHASMPLARRPET